LQATNPQSYQSAEEAVDQMARQAISVAEALAMITAAASEGIDPPVG